MLDLAYVRAHLGEVRQAIANRQDHAPLERIIELDQRRRALLTEAEALKGQRNTVSREISQMADSDLREAKIKEMKAVGARIDSLDAQVRTEEGELQRLLSGLPNLPDPRVPVGRDESENVVVRTLGEPRQFPFAPKAHWDLGPELGILNFEQGVRLSGSRFYVLHRAGARLQRALIAWMLDLHARQGYAEAYTPFMVRPEVLFGAGQLPKFEDNLFHDSEDGMWMVPTAEVPLTGLHMGEILEADQLPRWYTAYTPCFRREKAAAGRDVRGIKRGQQFDKVEMYKFCLTQNSETELEGMVADAEQTCRELGLTHRVKQLCTGDLGFSARITYDIEVWAPGCGEWLEVSSVSNCGDFQARRANIRYRPTRGAKPEFVHTLNGSGLGLPRTLIAVIENYQREDGSLDVPPVLLPWMGGVTHITPETLAPSAALRERGR
jgi:seryl-tRNA synthetase